MLDIKLKDLHQAYQDCLKGKRHTVNAQHYAIHEIDHLFNTQHHINTMSYSPSTSIAFSVKKPKAREIYAANFKDRVVHHYFIPRLEKWYELVFIHDVYSNRKNKGTHRAVKRLQSFMNSASDYYQTPCFMQLDIKNFFNSIDKTILQQQLEQRFSKLKRRIPAKQLAGLRYLTKVVIDHDPTKNVIFKRYDQRNKPAGVTSATLAQNRTQVPAHKQLVNAGAGKGLPIGNLSSQFFANVYMNALDQFVKHQLKCRYYLRYVDDFILIAENTETLLWFRERIIVFLQAELKLTLKELAKPEPLNVGADFLGYIVRPKYKLVRRRVLNNLREKLQHFKNKHIFSFSKAESPSCLSLLAKTQIDLSEIANLQAIIASYLGHFKHASSHNVIQRMLKEFCFLSRLFVFQADFKLFRKYQPPASFNYKEQINFFRNFYPYATLWVQKGYQQQMITPKKTRGESGEVLGVVVKETHWTKHNRKQRSATALFF